MPTTIRFAAVEQRAAFPPKLPPVSIFLMIALIELVVAALSSGQWAAFGEQSLWW